MNPKNITSLFNSIAFASLSLGAVISGVQTCLYTVDAGHRALIFDRIYGVKEKVISEGTHFRIPWFQKPIIYDVRVTPRHIRSETGSKDLQRIEIHLRILLRPDELKLPQIFQSLGTDFDEKVLPSIGNEVLKAVIAQYNAEELVTQRENISLMVRKDLTRRSQEFGIILDDVSITHLGFSREFTSAIELKQVAQQDAERQKFLVEKAKQEKLAHVILAEGETEAARLIAEANQTGNQFLELRRIEATKEIAETLASSRNVTYIPKSGNFLMTIPLGGPPPQQ